MTTEIEDLAPADGDIEHARLRFHWSMPNSSGGVRGATARAAEVGRPEPEWHGEFARRADEVGMDSLLIPVGFQRPDPVAFSAWLSTMTQRVRFMPAFRSGVVSPGYFVQQINALSHIAGGRVSVNMVAGTTMQEQGYFGDFLPHDERYQRTAEFLAMCHALWRGADTADLGGRYYEPEQLDPGLPFQGRRPEIYLGGQSAAAEDVAGRYADCHLSFADIPERVAARVAPVRERGVAVGLMVSLIVRSTTAEARKAAQELLDRAGEQAVGVSAQFRSRSDSVGMAAIYDMATTSSDWLTDTLWAGAVPYLGPTSIAVVGSPDEVATGLLEFAQAGISQVIFQGRPDLEQMTTFGREVLPIIRAREAAMARLGPGRQ